MENNNVFDKVISIYRTKYLIYLNNKREFYNFINYSNFIKIEEKHAFKTVLLLNTIDKIKSKNNIEVDNVDLYLETIKYLIDITDDIDTCLYILDNYIGTYKLPSLLDIDLSNEDNIELIVIYNVYYLLKIDSKLNFLSNLKYCKDNIENINNYIISRNLKVDTIDSDEGDVIDNFVIYKHTLESIKEIENKNIEQIKLF